MVEPHPVDRLFETSKIVEPYPDGVLPILKRIPGLAFFPGGYGLWGKTMHQPPPAFPIGGVMVVGHNFDCEKGYNRSFEARTERSTSPTWGPLSKVILNAGIKLERCFFTNAYMGLKAGDKAQGKFPGSLDSAFVKRCSAFLLHQIREQRPNLVLVLGLEAVQIVASISQDLDMWRQVTSLEDIYRLDRQGRSPVVSAFFEGMDHNVKVALLVHPCNRHVNAKGRSFGSIKGPSAEVAILKELRDTINWKN